MRRRSWLGFGVTLVTACSSGAASVSDEPAATTASAIVNGDLDTAHRAVVTVVSQAGGDEISVCTGTIVQTDPATGTGWVATAAHCINEGPPRAVWEGPDYLAQDRVRHRVLGYAADTRFDIDKPENGYDFAVVRIEGVDASTPVIPLASAPDGIVVGTAMDNVGFGRTTKPPAETDTNSKRHIVSTSIGQVSTHLLSYDSSQKGACQGDSGGPWLVGTGEDMRVVGIDSYGNTTCDGLAVAGRVQAGLDFFAAELGLVAPDPCELCQVLAKSSGGKCEKATSAGLEVCVCNEACAEECSAGCASSSSSDEPDAAAPEAPPPASDAGPTVVVVHKKGDGCDTSGRAPSGATLFGWLALALAVARLRPCRSARR